MSTGESESVTALMSGLFSSLLPTQEGAPGRFSLSATVLNEELQALHAREGKRWFHPKFENTQKSMI
jgi:hypothetical protein